MKQSNKTEISSYEGAKSGIFLTKDYEKRKKHFQQSKAVEKVVIKSSNEISYLMQDQERRGIGLKKSYFK